MNYHAILQVVQKLILISIFKIYSTVISVCARIAKTNYQLTMLPQSYVKLKKANLRPKQVETVMQRPKKSIAFAANTWTHYRNDSFKVNYSMLLSRN